MRWRVRRRWGVEGVWLRGSGDLGIDRYGALKKVVFVFKVVDIVMQSMLKHLDGDSYLVSTGNVVLYQSGDGQDVKDDKDLGGDIDELLLVEEVSKNHQRCFIVCIASTCMMARTLDAPATRS